MFCLKLTLTSCSDLCSISAMSLHRMEQQPATMSRGRHRHQRGSRHEDEVVEYAEPEFDMTYENLVNLSPVRCGLDSDTLAALPKTKLTTEMISKLPEERCSVCLCDYAEGDEILTLPCNHIFHTDCITSWLLESKVCPCCKQQIGPE